MTWALISFFSSLPSYNMFAKPLTIVLTLFKNTLVCSWTSAEVFQLTQKACVFALKC